MANLNKRQIEILNFIKKNSDSNSSAIFDFIAKNFENTSKITIIRDLNLLLEKKLIARQGRGRNVNYKELLQNKLLRSIDVEDYFSKGPDERNVAHKNFNFNIFNDMDNIFDENEIKELDQLNKKYHKNIKNMDEATIKKEFERLTIELSWKSSKIEGNTYSLIDTEVLIKENQEADGHKREEAIMILNHKIALDYIFKNLRRFKKLDIKDVEDIHKLIVKDLGVKTGLRKRIIGITGTLYKPLDNQYQVREAMERTVKALNKIKDPFSKALLCILLISYIQPFTDGNKRTSRLMGNATLLANNACPLSFRSINEADYKKAVVLFYEQNNASFFKKLFVEQFRFSVGNYFN